jgi:flavorubredoxin
MENTFIEQGVYTVVHNLAYADLGDVAKDLTDSTALILATPTVIGFAHPLMTQVTYLAKLLKPPVKYVGLVIIYAWGTNADKQLGDTLRELGVEIVDVVKINVTPTGDDVRRVKELAIKISQKVKELGSSRSLI